MASGPLGERVTVDYYAGLKKLQVLRRYGDNPYVVQLEPLPAGLHVIYAVTSEETRQEISHPSTIMFEARGS